MVEKAPNPKLADQVQKNRRRWYCPMQDVVQLCSFLLQAVIDAKGLHGFKKIL